MSNNLNGLVLGTTNKSEHEIGYFTKWGDGAVDIEPIIGLFKSEVKAMAIDMGIPKTIIDKPPTAGLWEGQTDENDIGMDYNTLDTLLKMRERGDKSTAPVARRMENLINKNSHKLSMPKGCIINEGNESDRIKSTE
jgi:NAD+ synthase